MSTDLLWKEVFFCFLSMFILSFHVFPCTQLSLEINLTCISFVVVVVFLFDPFFLCLYILCVSYSLLWVVDVTLFDGTETSCSLRSSYALLRRLLCSHFWHFARLRTTTTTTIAWRDNLLSCLLSSYSLHGYVICTLYSHLLVLCPSIFIDSCVFQAPTDKLISFYILTVSLLRGLKHNNIVTLHDIIHTEKSLTLVFEYLVSCLAWTSQQSSCYIAWDTY